MFDENKIMWTAEECEVGAAADRIYEGLAESVRENWNISAIIANFSYTDFGKVIKYLFEDGASLPHFLDKSANIISMLRRDNYKP
jgi:hypothetical protein